MKSKKLQKKNGFTMTEVMVVVVIITVLSTVAFVAANRAKESAKSTATLNQLRQIGGASGSWMMDNQNFFPPCWNDTEGANQSYAQTLGWYLHGKENFRDSTSAFIGPNKRENVEVNQWSHPITFSMNRAVCRDITQRGRVWEKLVHATHVDRLADVILMADGCQNPSNLNQANASAYRVYAATGEMGPSGRRNEAIPVGPDEDTAAGDGWFRYPNGKCSALMCDGSARVFTKGSITNGNLWVNKPRTAGRR